MSFYPEEPPPTEAQLDKFTRDYLRFAEKSCRDDDFHSVVYFPPESIPLGDYSQYLELGPYQPPLSIGRIQSRPESEWQCSESWKWAEGAFLPGAFENDANFKERRGGPSTADQSLEKGIAGGDLPSPLLLPTYNV